MKYKSLSVLILATVATASGCNEEYLAAPTVCGIYSFHTSDSSIHHGVDILVINKDATYSHFYTKGSSGKDLEQSGHWSRYGATTINLDAFVAWDLFGPLPDGVTYPTPARTALPLTDGLNGFYEIDAGPDRGEKFIQIERCSQ